MFLSKASVLLTYFDDCVIVSQKKDTITSIIQSLNNVPKNYVLTHEGDISNYLGFNIKRSQMGHSNDHNHNWWRKSETMSDLKCM